MADVKIGITKLNFSFEKNGTFVDVQFNTSAPEEIPPGWRTNLFDENIPIATILDLTLKNLAFLLWTPGKHDDEPGG